MQGLTDGFLNLKAALKTRGLTWITETIPHHYSRYRATGIEQCASQASVAGCVEYSSEALTTEAAIDEALYRATSEFMRTESLEQGKIGIQQNPRIWRIENGRVYTNNAAQYFVISKANKLVAPASFKYRDAVAGVAPDQLQLNARFFPKPDHYNGRVLNLILGGGPATNIFHWMIDAVPAVKIAEENFQVADFDHVLVQGKDNGFRLKSLQMLGFQSEQIRFVNQQLIHIEADELIATSHPRSRLNNLTPRWVIDFHRQRYLPKIDQNPDPDQYPDKIYISRKDSKLRGVLNEDEVIEFLQARGYQEILLSQYNYDEKVALFHHAREIITMSGAALAFLMYCQARASVLELFPAGFVHYANAAIASQVDLDYQYKIFGELNTHRSGFWAQREAMHVDLTQLESCISSRKETV